MITEEYLKENGFLQKDKVYELDLGSGRALIICGFQFKTDVWAVHIKNYIYEPCMTMIAETKQCKLTLIKTKEQFSDVLKVFGLNAT